MREARAGETILLIQPDKKRLLVNLEPGGVQHTHHGIVVHDDIIDRPLGRTLSSHLGKRFVVLRPSMEELLVSLRRATQIIFPKDIGYILLKLSVFPGQRVIEAGTGSGAMAIAFARYSSPGGMLYTYEQREQFYELAGQNLARAGLLEAVTRHNRPIGDGFEERDVDAVFLDVRDPWTHLDAVLAALGPGGHFGAIVPTVNQVARLLEAMEPRELSDVEVAEIMLRQYKPVADRLRPKDRLTAHTGYLIFARRIVRAAPRDAVIAERAAEEFAEAVEIDRRDDIGDASGFEGVDEIGDVAEVEDLGTVVSDDESPD